MTEEEIAEIKRQAESLEAEKAKLIEKNKELQAEKKRAQEAASKFSDVDLDEYKSLKEKASEFDGVTPEELSHIRELQKQAKDDAEKDLLKTGGIEAVVEARIKDMTKRSEEKFQHFELELKKRDTEIQNFKAVERDRRFDAMIADGVKKHGKFIDDAADLVSPFAKQFVRYSDEGQPEVFIDGDVYYSPEDPSRRGTVSEFIQYKLPELKPSLLKQSSGVGAKGSDGAGEAENPWMLGARKGLEAKKRIEDQNPALAKRMRDAAMTAGKHPRIP